MITREFSFYSDGIRLDGLLELPNGVAPGERRPAIVLCSGFQGLKELIPAKLWGPLTEAGYVCFSFDYRGLGTSAGERGRIIPAEQVADVRAAITILGQQPEVDPSRIGLVGWGFGGGIVVQASAEDERARAVVCLNGIGDGGRAVRGTRSVEDWLEVNRAIAADRIERALTGYSRLVSPWVVVPLDLHTLQNVDEDMYGNHPRFARASVSLQSAEAYYEFRPETVVDRISPRPLLIVHGRQNALHPIEEARSLFARARDPKEFIEIPSAQHLDWIQPGDPLYLEYVPRIVSWLRQRL